MRALSAPTKRQKILSACLGYALIGVIGLIDSVTPDELSFSTFYLIPLFLIAWNASTWLAVVGAGVCAVAWSVADLMSGNMYTSLVFLCWNIGVRLVLVMVVAIVLSALSASLEAERALARSDPLTGAANTRSFMETLKREVERSARYGRVFSIAYMDLDNFKKVNDTFGHGVGDEVLQTVVASIRARMRTSDTVARMGGDEFALLLPETEEKAAAAVMEKIRSCILEEMRRRGWPITVSIGCYTCAHPPLDAVRLITLADNLMYEAKNGGKNSIAFASSAPPTASS